MSPWGRWAWHTRANSGCADIGGVGAKGGPSGRTGGHRGRCQNQSGHHLSADPVATGLWIRPGWFVVILLDWRNKEKNNRYRWIHTVRIERREKHQLAFFFFFLRVCTLQWASGRRQICAVMLYLSVSLPRSLSLSLSLSLSRPLQLHYNCSFLVRSEEINYKEI